MSRVRFVAILAYGLTSLLLWAACGSKSSVRSAPAPHLPDPQRTGTLHLLRQENFTALETRLGNLEAQAERYPVFEAELALAYRAFWTSDATVGALLAEWARRSPDSAQARLSRAKHLAKAGWDRRGTKYARETPAESFSHMHRLHKEAQDEATAAIRIQPRMSEAYATLINLALARGDTRECKAVAAKALDVLPLSFRVRETLLGCMEPRWGGSFGEMRRVARDVRLFAARNPRLIGLAGYEDAEKGRLLALADRYEEAIERYDSALTRGEDWQFYAGRAEAFKGLRQHDRALADLHRALQLQPEEPRLLIDRARQLMELDRAGEAVADLLLAETIDPAEGDLPRLREQLVAAASWQGHHAEGAGRSAMAVGIFDKALELEPLSVDPYYRRGIARWRQGDEQGAVADLRRAIELEPTHFEACRNLDHLLANKGDWGAILDVWNRFLSLEPHHAGALLERAGTHHHAGNEAAARLDLEAACGMGNAQACSLLQR